jgi:hypothetical protein
MPESLMNHLFADDCLYTMFSYLTVPEMMQVSLTCKQWFRVSCSDSLWEQMLKKTYMDFDELQYKCNNHNVFLLSRLAVQDQYKPLTNILLEESDHFRNHTVRRRKLLSFAPLYLWRIRNVFTVQLLSNAIAYLVSTFCIVVAITLLCILLPIYLDGIVQISVSNLNWTILPSALLIFIPFIVILSANCVNMIILRPRGAQYSKFFTEIGITFRGSSINDNDSVQLAFCIMTSWIMSVPIILGCLYLRLWISPVYNPPYMSFQLSVLPYYVATVLFIIITPFLIVYRIQGTIITRVLWVLYFIGTIFNILVSTQVALVAAKLDQSLPTYWTIIFLPVWICGAIVILLLVFSPLIPQLFRNESTKHFVIYLLRCFTVLAFLAAPAFLTLIVLTLRMDLISDYFYTYAFFPMYTLWASLVGVMLGVLFYICLTPLLDRCI